MMCCLLQGVLVLIFICCSRQRVPYKQVPPAEDLKVTMTNSESHNSSNGHAGGSAIAIDRPPGMNGIITCNSYKNRHGTWHRRESGAVLIGPYSTSYGSCESRGFLESVA
jgi:hypothetical protein